MKKETLEEASKYYSHNNFDMHEKNNYKALLQGFKAGAKWQQERLCDSEVIQRIRASKSDAEVIRIIKTI